MLPRRHTVHAAEEIWPDRKRVVHRGQGRKSQRLSLQRRQGGRDRVNQIIGKELADQNIAVNCITPAAARTRIFDQMSQEHLDYRRSKIPRGRFLELDEIGAMVAWLVSEENSFTNGAAFDLSGGRATY